MSANNPIFGSPEILVLIFASCDTFVQAIALASTCRQLHSVWKLNSASILGRVALRCIPAFDDALVAARATEIAKAAILNGKLVPKDINIPGLCTAACKPQVSDIVGVLSLRRLVESTEQYYLQGRAWDGVRTWDGAGCDESGAPRHLPDRDEWQRSYRVYFHRAVYRVLLAGPILAGWHMEPFASNGIPNRIPPDVPANLRLFLRDHEPDIDPWNDIGLEDEDIAYLEKFLPFDQDANARVSEKQDILFGPLATWLIQSATKHIASADKAWAERTLLPSGNRRTRELDLSGFRGGSADEGIIILREIMRMLVAYENLTRSLGNADDRSGHGRIGNDEDPDPTFIRSGARKSFAIILGVYQMEQVDYSEEGVLLATPVGPLPNGYSLGPVPDKAIDIFGIQEYLYRFSGRANHISGGQAPPMQLQLFNFLLRRYFNIQFQLGWLWTRSKYDDYYEFLTDAGIFNNNTKSDGTSILVDFSNEPVYTFQTLS